MEWARLDPTIRPRSGLQEAKRVQAEAAQRFSEMVLTGIEGSTVSKYDFGFLVV